MLSPSYLLRPSRVPNQALLVGNMAKAEPGRLGGTGYRVYQHAGEQQESRVYKGAAAFIRQAVFWHSSYKDQIYSFNGNFSRLPGSVCAE